MNIHIGLDALANELFTRTIHKELGELQLSSENLHVVWQALDSPVVVVAAIPGQFPLDIVTEDVIPGAKRITMTVAVSAERPTIRVVVVRPTAGQVGGPYSATFDLAFPKVLPKHLQNDVFRWLRDLLFQVYPEAPRQRMEGSSKPTGIPLVDEGFPQQLLPPTAFGLDEVRLTTNYDPQTKSGGVETVELLLSTPDSGGVAPFLNGIPDEFLFLNRQREGVWVELHFDQDGGVTLAQIDGAILVGNGEGGLTALPLQWTSRMPGLFAGSFDADAQDADPPFQLGALLQPLGKLQWMLKGIDHLLIRQAELTCDLEARTCDFVGQCAEDAVEEIAGVPCTDLVIAFKWRMGEEPAPSVAMLRGLALRDQDEPPYFRIASVWSENAWISALEANRNTRKTGGEIPLADRLKELDQALKPDLVVEDMAMGPQLVQLDEQRRGAENEFDELIGER